MTDTLTFTDRVVVITGAGNGIGRAYAHEFARRGAKVVVNDLGGSVQGDGNDSSAADFVVNEIVSANGNAVANYHSVVDGEAVVQTALDTYGRIDVLINNAGIAYPTPFEEMNAQRWQRMMDVHVQGSYACTYAAWKHMKAQRYGRLLFTSSPFGVYASANFAHYSAAKAGLIGLMKALALEGRDQHIHSNAVAPYSASRMTGRTNEEQLTSPLSPVYLAQLAVWLCHEQTEETGSLYEVGGGYIHKLRWEMSQGLHLPGTQHTAENIAAGAAKLDDFTGSLHPALGDSHTIGRAVFGTQPH